MPGDMVRVPPGWVHAVRNLRVSPMLRKSKLCSACPLAPSCTPCAPNHTPRTTCVWCALTHTPPVHPPVQACIKIAWDGFKLEHMPAYVEQAHVIGARVVPATNGADDYMAVAPVAAAALLRMWRKG